MQTIDSSTEYFEFELEKDYACISAERVDEVEKEPSMISKIVMNALALVGLLCMALVPFTQLFDVIRSYSIKKFLRRLRRKVRRGVKRCFKGSKSNSNGFEHNTKFVTDKMFGVESENTNYRKL
jgi:hypothetical protein